MIRSALIEKLNKYTFLQYILVILPFLMILVYVFAYMTDMLSIARNLEVNNSISQRAWDMDELREVEYIEDETGVVNAVVSGTFSSIEEVSAEEPIFYVQIYSTEWYQIVTKSDKSSFMEQCDLFDSELTEDGTVIVSHEGISYEAEPGDIVCYVAISKEGLYRVTFLNEGEDYYDLESLHMLELMPSESGGGYRVQVSSNYELSVDDMEVNFCSNLPTDGLYYNESTQSFVRNVSKDYGITFVIKSNIAIVFLSTMLYVLLMYEFVNKEKKLMLLQNKPLKFANELAVCMLPLCVIVTMIML